MLEVTVVPQDGITTQLAITNSVSRDNIVVLRDIGCAPNSSFEFWKQNLQLHEMVVKCIQNPLNWLAKTFQHQVEFYFQYVWI